MKKTGSRKIEGKGILIYQLYLGETYDQRILFIEAEKRTMKNFFLGDHNLHGILEKTLKKKDLIEEEKIIEILKSIKINFTPKREQILSQYQHEIN